MWPFSAKAKPKVDLEVRVEKLERKVRDLSMDWDSTYEKFAKLHARLCKRDKAEARAAEEAAGDTNGDEAGGRVASNPLAARLLNPYGAGR
jgi:hypothetical protein